MRTIECGQSVPHSIVLNYGNALIFQRKFFLRVLKNRISDPSEICALDIKAEFRRPAISSVSATIGNNRSISPDWPTTLGAQPTGKKTVSA